MSYLFTKNSKIANQISKNIENLVFQLCDLAKTSERKFFYF